MIIPLFGTTLSGKSKHVSAQDRTNVYLEMSRDPEKGQVALYGMPGMVLAHDLDDRTWDGNQSAPVTARGYSLDVTGPVRALGVSRFSDAPEQTFLWAIKGTAVWTLDEDSVQKDNSEVRNNGTPDTSQSRLVVAPMPATAWAIANGASRSSFLFPPVGTLSDSGTGTLWVQELTDTDIPSSVTSLTALAGWEVATYVGSPNIIYWPTTLDPLTPSAVDPLDFQAVQDSGDVALRVASYKGSLVVFCRNSTEFFTPTGDADLPFSPVRGASLGFGLAALHAVAVAGDLLVFLARNAQGQTQVVALSGYTAVVISDPEVEHIINNLAFQGDASALSYQWGGHTFIQFNWTVGNLSLVYDMHSKAWHRAEDVNGDRHRAEWAVNWNGTIYLSDYEDGRIYTLSDEAYDNDGEAMPREVVTRHFFKDYERVIVDELQVDFEVGVGNDDVEDPQVMLQVSKDNGRSWGTELWASLGAVGETTKRVVWRRLGMGRDWTFKLRVTDAAKFVISSASLKATPIG